jgi:HPt (histidine-containing phosphotransfer) domain-containing protein
LTKDWLEGLPQDLRLKYLALQKIYVQGLAERLQALTQAEKSQDFQALGQLAHKLCGGAAAYGFDELSRLARQLERSAQTDDAQTTAIAYAQLCTALQQVLNQHKA